MHEKAWTELFTCLLIDKTSDILHVGVVGLEPFLAPYLHRTTPAWNVSATHLVSRAGFVLLCVIASMGYEHARTFVTRGLWDVLALRRTTAVPVSSLLAVLLRSLLPYGCGMRGIDSRERLR